MQQFWDNLNTNFIALNLKIFFLKKFIHPQDFFRENHYTKQIVLTTLSMIVADNLNKNISAIY